MEKVIVPCDSYLDYTQSYRDHLKKAWSDIYGLYPDFIDDYFRGCSENSKPGEPYEYLWEYLNLYEIADKMFEKLVVKEVAGILGLPDTATDWLTKAYEKKTLLKVYWRVPLYQKIVSVMRKDWEEAVNGTEIE